MGKKYKTTAIFIAVSLSVLLVVSLIIWWKPIAIKYHKQRINALLNRKPKLDQGSGLSYFDEEWGDAFEKYRDKLVKLGYLERKEFPLTFIKTPSLRFRRLWEELQARFPTNPYAIGLGYESNSPATIVVFDKADKLSEWERIILAHDAPPTNIVVGVEKGNMQDLLSFVGQWVNEDGEVCYIITQDTEGNLKIETAPNDAWRTVLKNMRLEGKRIMLDQFSYTDPNEDYKSIIDRSGEHPFSGVRFETVLEVNPKDSNELLTTGSSVGKYGIFTDPNKSVLRRLK